MGEHLTHWLTEADAVRKTVLIEEWRAPVMGSPRTFLAKFERAPKRRVVLNGVRLDQELQARGEIQMRYLREFLIGHELAHDLMDRIGPRPETAQEREQWADEFGTFWAERA